MNDKEQEAANRLRLWLRYSNPRPNPISDEGKQFENDLQLVTELAAALPLTDFETAPALRHSLADRMKRASYELEDGTMFHGPIYIYANEFDGLRALLVASPSPSEADAALVADRVCKHFTDIVMDWTAWHDLPAEQCMEIESGLRSIIVAEFAARPQAAPHADPDPYVPTVLHNEAAGFYEFVSEDVPGVWRFIAPNIEQMVSMKDRERVVGMRAHALTNHTASLPAEGWPTNAEENDRLLFRALMLHLTYGDGSDPGTMEDVDASMAELTAPDKWPFYLPKVKLALDAFTAAAPVVGPRAEGWVMVPRHAVTRQKSIGADLLSAWSQVTPGAYDIAHELYDQMVAAAPPAPSGLAGREEIARIIDPHYWSIKDRGGDLLPAMPGDTDRTPRALRPSLAKAGEILALRSPTSEAGGEELRSAAKNARRILSDYAADAEDDTVVRAIEALDLALVGASWP